MSFLAKLNVLIVDKINKIINLNKKVVKMNKKQLIFMNVLFYIFIIIFFSACEAYINIDPDPTYTVIYNENGSTGGSVPTDATGYRQGQTVTVLSNTGNLVITGYTFIGWNTQADGNGEAYIQGQSFTMGTTNVTLYAKWTINQYTVTYHGNGSTGGSVPVSTNHDYNNTVTISGNTGSLVKINVSEASYRFAGWNTQEDGNGTNYEAGIGTFTMGSMNIILYAKWVAYVLRDTGPAGGLIFYDKGSYSNGWRYLEAASVDQTSRVWGTRGDTGTGADGTAIGTGKQNTLDIITGDPASNKAADECDNYSIENEGVTYDDWFLPSKDELNQMYLNLELYGYGGFASDFYWSSSKYNANYAWRQYFGNGNQYYLGKEETIRVRAVRDF